jgi:hypothetical protein
MLTQFLAYVEDTSIDIELTAVTDMSTPTSNKNFIPMDQITCYCNRPLELQSLSPYALLTLFKIERGNYSKKKWLRRLDENGNDSSHHDFEVPEEDLQSEDPYGTRSLPTSINVCGYPFRAAYPFANRNTDDIDTPPVLKKYHLVRFENPNCVRIIGPPPPDRTQFLDINNEVIDKVEADIYANGICKRSIDIYFKGYCQKLIFNKIIKHLKHLG